MENIDIIISRYNENLSWTLEPPFCNFKYIVYNKGINENFEKINVKQIINLPNVGRCDHTYFYHIVKNYDKLNNIIVFFPGSLNMRGKKEQAIKLINEIKNNNYSKAIFICQYTKDLIKEFYNFSLTNWQATYQENKLLNNESVLQLAKIRPFNKWFLFNFGSIEKYNYFVLRGIFSIDKRDIIQHDIKKYEFFEKILSIHSNPEVGHYIERSYGAIFAPFNYTKILVE